MEVKCRLYQSPKMPFQFILSLFSMGPISSSRFWHIPAHGQHGLNMPLWSIVTYNSGLYVLDIGVKRCWETAPALEQCFSTVSLALPWFMKLGMEACRTCSFFFFKQPDGTWVSLAAGETFSLILKLKLYQLMAIHYCKLEVLMNTHMSLDE